MEVLLAADPEDMEEVVAVDTVVVVMEERAVIAVTVAVVVVEVMAAEVAEVMAVVDEVFFYISSITYTYKYFIFFF